VLDDLGTKVLQVVITELHDGTFFAEIEFTRDGGSYRISSPPSAALPLPAPHPPPRRHRPGRPLRRAGADLRPRGRAGGGRRALRAGRGRGADRAVPVVPRPGAARGLRPRRIGPIRAESARAVR